MADLPNEDGYELWLRYRAVANGERLAEYHAAIQHVTLLDESESAAHLALEMIHALARLLDVKLKIQRAELMQPQLVQGALVVGTLPTLQAVGVGKSCRCAIKRALSLSKPWHKAGKV